MKARSVKPEPAPASPAPQPAAPAGEAGKTREARNEQIKELIKLAEAQGYLTFQDINETIPDEV
ncbi:MAG: RNA polymerase sigma factor region1.1 domain-containing protein, partial [Lentisphaerae bacterium]|nr:RNA polymerase sigma factor region1.1 domain-containing protein [Lentisphaerota bacterium]